MTEQEILEGNKLIAEFMGGEIWERVNHPPGNMRKEMVFKKYPKDMPDDQYATSLLADCRYNLSWEWLMPVIEKIETLPLEEHHKYEFTLTSRFATVYDHSGSPPYTRCHESDDSKILAAYKCVVSFIKWHNKTKLS